MNSNVLINKKKDVECKSNYNEKLFKKKEIFNKPTQFIFEGEEDADEDWVKVIIIIKVFIKFLIVLLKILKIKEI